MSNEGRATARGSGGGAEERDARRAAAAAARRARRRRAPPPDKRHRGDAPGTGTYGLAGRLPVSEKLAARLGSRMAARVADEQDRDSRPPATGSDAQSVENLPRSPRQQSTHSSLSSRARMPSPRRHYRDHGSDGSGSRQRRDGDSQQSFGRTSVGGVAGSTAPQISSIKKSRYSQGKFPSADQEPKQGGQDLRSRFKLGAKRKHAQDGDDTRLRSSTPDHAVLARVEPKHWQRPQPSEQVEGSSQADHFPDASGIDEQAANGERTRGPSDPDRAAFYAHFESLKPNISNQPEVTCPFSPNDLGAFSELPRSHELSETEEIWWSGKLCLSLSQTAQIPIELQVFGAYINKSTYQDQDVEQVRDSFRAGPASVMLTSSTFRRFKDTQKKIGNKSVLLLILPQGKIWSQEEHKRQRADLLNAAEMRRLVARLFWFEEFMQCAWREDREWKESVIFMPLSVNYLAALDIRSEDLKFKNALLATIIREPR
ncbi:hypothetical protein FVE85_6815 [Porphyridium purpureum]|uniref:Uncharacterized protein n=1 Tax=Porphyridium purpureum TaxID=35688 RepID=A0A5J4Z800_PORPP|nr:hypothetical protein FVE85_6815 [Porphyridium purpureum]|eukprot:POR1403..scf295_1